MKIHYTPTSLLAVHQPYSMPQSMVAGVKKKEKERRYHINLWGSKAISSPNLLVADHLDTPSYWCVRPLVWFERLQIELLLLHGINIIVFREIIKIFCSNKEIEYWKIIFLLQKLQKSGNDFKSFCVIHL